MSELKPCPFCGHTPMIFNQAGLVTCRYAMCSANPQANSKEDWNKRTETEHLRLKEEECKQLQQDKAELLKALEVSTRAWDQYFKNGEMFDYDEYESHEKVTGVNEMILATKWL